MRPVLLALLLPGCSLLFETAPASAPDAGPSAPDAGPSAPDAASGLPANVLGTYSITFEVIGGCSVSVFTEDRLDVSQEGLVFRAEACATHENISVSYEEIDAGELVLWNCERTVRYDVAPFTLIFEDGAGSAEIQANQVLPPSMNVSCTGEFLLRAER